MQLKAEAKKQKRPVVLVTDDRKEDWYRREHGLTLGARWELREEMMAEADVPFIIMTTETFLYHAEKYLNAEVSPETVDQAKELSTVGRFEIRPSAQLLQFFESELERVVAKRIADVSPMELTSLAQLLVNKRRIGLPEDEEALEQALDGLLWPHLPVMDSKSDEVDAVADQPEEEE